MPTTLSIPTLEIKNGVAWHRKIITDIGEVILDPDSNVAQERITSILNVLLSECEK